MLTLHNTLTGRQEPFESIEPKRVRMYVCGVTVYDYCHIGHARSALVFDVLRRYLEYSGYRVDFVKNFTDVDDKIIKRANERGVSCDAITSEFIDAYYEDMGRLGIQRATKEPKATEHMAEIIAITETLMKKGLAYAVNGDVYFQVEKYPAYGRLSKRKLEDLQAGARVDVDERKRHPMDFALWKSSKPGEPSWHSPWGPGRPGWHIECSAMSIKHLGETFDIHGGGMDLIFPHHENEIAQSCGATEKEFARYWIHNGFVQVNQEKMSKSLGNFFTIREIFEKEKSQWPEQEIIGEMLRYLLLSTHYRGPLDFSDQSLKEAKNALDGFYDLFRRLDEEENKAVADNGLKDLFERSRIAFEDAMDDDLNTPMAIAALQMLRSEVNKSLERGLSTELRQLVREQFRSLGKVLGLFELNNWRFNPAKVHIAVADEIRVTEDAMSRIRGKDHPAYRSQEYAPPLPLLEEERIRRMVDERNEARKMKDFKRADAIRQELASLGITIEDKPDGTSRWKR